MGGMTAGTATTLAYPIVQTTLPNGLRVVASPDHGAPSVAVNLWYDVGSRDEQTGRTGFAHLFEHVMFQGSAHVPSGQHIALLQAAGASVNATTWFDRTNYFETLPVGGLDLALWLEADRLGTLLDALTQENLDNQREVVKEEKRQRYDNVPYGDVMELLNGLTFPADHPYGHTTIGSMDDLDAATLADVQAFFRTHYLPNNAVLSIVGDVEPDDAVRARRHLLRRARRRAQARQARRHTATRAQRLGALRDLGPAYRRTRSTCPGDCRPAAPGSSTRWTWRSRSSARGRPPGCTSQLVRGTRARRGDGRLHARADRRQLVRVRLRPGPRRGVPGTARGRAGGRDRPARAPTGRRERSCGGPRRSTNGTGCTSWPGSTRARTPSGEYATLHGDPNLINPRTDRDRGHRGRRTLAAAVASTGSAPTSARP